jgi:hypothetical protein
MDTRVSLTIGLPFEESQIHTTRQADVLTGELTRHLGQRLPERKSLSYLLTTDPEPSWSETDEPGTEQQSSRDIFARSQIIVREPRQDPRTAKFVSLQQWEGVVVHIRGDSLIARLADLTAKGLEEEAEIPIEELPEEETELIEPGAVFYWNVGYYESPRGQRIRASSIRFRRLPAWSGKELEKVQARAKELSDYLDWK